MIAITYLLIVQAFGSISALRFAVDFTRHPPSSPCLFGFLILMYTYQLADLVCVCMHTLLCPLLNVFVGLWRKKKQALATVYFCFVCACICSFTTATSSQCAAVLLQESEVCENGEEASCCVEFKVTAIIQHHSFNSLNSFFWPPVLQIVLVMFPKAVGKSFGQ